MAPVMAGHRNVQEPFVQWAKAAFAEEIKIGFSRAKIFDAPVNEVIWAALEEFSTAQLQILGRILPALPVSEFRDSLTDEERSLADAFVAARNRAWMARQEEIGIQMEKILERPIQKEAVAIRKKAGDVFKEIARHWGYEIRKVEPRVWLLSHSATWGTIWVPFDLHDRIEFSYHIRIENDQLPGLPQADTYLGRLGLMGSSPCKVLDASTCSEKFWKVAELIHWQLQNYVRIVESLVNGNSASSSTA